MLVALPDPVSEQIDESSRQSRSPSADSLSRLHQQSGGFASQNIHLNHQNSQQNQQRRGSVSKDGTGGYYSQQSQNSGGYRKQGFSQRGSRNNSQRSGNNFHQNSENLGTNFQHGYQPKQRSYQNYSQHNPKYYPHQQRPIFNSTAEMGSFSVRRQSPSSPSSPTPSTTNTSNRNTAPAPILLRHVESDKLHSGSSNEQEQHHDAKIHQYRSAGTAPGGFSNSSSPYKQQSQQTPTTPSDKRSDTDEWPSRFQHPPPGLQNQLRRHHDNIPPPIELQRKNPIPSVSIEIASNSQPTTPSHAERLSQFRTTGKDSQLGDNVDAKHPCFADERMHSALYGVSPQVKSQHQPSGPPIQNEREASISIEALKVLQFQQQQWQQQMARNGVYYPHFMYALDSQMRQLKQQCLQQNPNQQKELSFDAESSSAGKATRRRDSSNDSRSSSDADPNAIPHIMENMDNELMGADLDKTPTVEKEGYRKSRMNEPKIWRRDQSKTIGLPRKANRRDSIGSNASSASGHSSPTVDESTLTKIYPGDEFRGGRGVASPSPPAALLSEPLSRMDVLSEKIWDYHNKVSQTDEMLQRKLHLRDMLYTAISPVFPLSGLYVVGSSLNGFGNNSSDMDLCLMITNKDLDQKNDAVVVLNLILSTLQYEKFVASQKLILAKVPILRIKFAAPFDDITVDLNANNSVAIRNTHLLCYYSSYDWRVRPLVSVVKEWAKRKGINDANKSSFTSYSLVLMVIHYLQCGTEAKVLPNLQQSYPTRFSNKVDVRTLNVTMPLEPVPDDIDPSLSENTTLGELLIGFLDYYANEFNYDRDAISIRQGRRVERAALAVRPKVHLNSEGDKETPPPSSSASTSSIHNGGIPMHYSMSNPHFWRSQWRCVCIEEPFTNSNTAHSIYDEMVFGAIKEAFREAHGELQENRDLDRLLECEPIKASITNAGAAVFAATYEGERPAAQQPNSIASVSLSRAMSAPAPSGGGHFHYQQQSSQQLMKHQRAGSSQGYQPNTNRSSHGNSHQHQQQNRRVYNSQSSSSAGNGANGSRISKSNESLKDTPSQSQQNHRPQHNQRNSSGSAKENQVSTNGASHSTEKKQSTTKRDEGNRTKRSSMIQSPEPTKPKTEKIPMTPTKTSH